jgi:predicted lipoprotein with Yx(FWY)xxD motif
MTALPTPLRRSLPGQSRHLRLGLALAAPAILLAACGGGYAGSTAASTGAPASSAPHGPGAASAVVKTTSGALGTYVTDGSGRTLYLFMADHGGRSTCSGACAAAWPPFTAKGAPTAAGGAKAGMLDTVPRDGGSEQVTYGGHPLYYFAGDNAAGDTNGQGVDGFGAKWWVVSPAGAAVTHGQGGGTGGSGGYGGYGSRGGYGG